MKVQAIVLASALFLSLSSTPLWADESTGQGAVASQYESELKKSMGVIGIVIEVDDAQTGEPATVYVIKVREDGPAKQAGVRPGDEIVSVNGTPVRGKSKQHVVSMIRGEAGTPVKLEIRGTRELSVTRVAAEKIRVGEHSGLGDEQREQPLP